MEQKARLRRVLAVVLCLLSVASGFGQARKDGGKQFRVCADPENLPFSNQKLEGFENKIAELFAKEFRASLSYVWWGQRQGFIRNTMNATLEEARCDVVMGVPVGYDLVETTRPYYRSTYVFVYPKGKGLQIKSLNDPILKRIKIGVHLIGDDYMNPPPVHELSKRGIVNNVVGFDTFYSAQNPPGRIIDAVAEGKVGAAIVWGPVAGYFVGRQKTPLEITPVPAGESDLPLMFDIAMGVRPGDKMLKGQLEQVLQQRQSEIQKILKDYGVPLLDRAGGKGGR
jgi:quinoprotein dehydrogenase-associated probable ABC transporter substrate-binding protein